MRLYEFLGQVILPQYDPEFHGDYMSGENHEMFRELKESMKSENMDERKSMKRKLT